MSFDYSIVFILGLILTFSLVIKVFYPVFYTKYFSYLFQTYNSIQLEVLYI